MADGSITISTELDNKKLEKDYQKLLKRIEKMEGELTQKKGEQSPLIAQAEELRRKIREARDEAERYKQAWVDGVTGADSEEMKARVRVSELEEEYNEVLDRVEVYDTKIADINNKLDVQREKAGEIIVALTEAGKSASRMGEAIDKAGGYTDKIIKKIKELAKRAFVFAIIAKALSGLRDWMGKVLKTNDEAAQAMARFKGALLTLAQPLVNIVIPAFTALVNVLSRVLEVLARITSFIFGTTAEESAKAAEALHSEANALDEVGASAKKAGKQMAAFDEINQISSDSGGAGVGGSSGNVTAPDFSAFDIGYIDKINALEITAAAAILAIGAILTFTGVNPPIGIAMMVGGAIGLYSALSVSWDGFSKEMQQGITAALALSGAVLLVIGAILTFAAGKPLIGITMMALGASELYAALALNWGGMSAEMQQGIATALWITGAVLIVIGALLAFTGVATGVGVAMMAAGVSEVYAALALNWGSLSDEARAGIAGTLTIAGVVMIVLGAVLAFSGANIPVGIFLLATGAASEYAGATLIWNSLDADVRSAVTSIALLLGESLLVLGAILAFSGVNIPLGIGLMLAGASLLGTAAALNWGGVKSALEGPIGDITLLVSVALLALGAILCFSGANIPLGIAFLLGGATLLATTVAVNWNAATDKVGYVLTAIGKIVAGAAVVIGVILLATGGGIPLGLALIGGGASAFFGLSSIGSAATSDELVDNVGKGLKNVEKEIDSHQAAIKSSSKRIGSSLTDGTAEAITDGEGNVRTSFVKTLEGGVRAGNEAMDIDSPSGVTKEQGERIVEGWLLALSAGIVTVGSKTAEVMAALNAAVLDSRQGIVNSFRGTYNAILDSSEMFISRYLSGLRQMAVQAANVLSAMPDAPRVTVPSVPKITLPPIPMLAQGAVIPPNREFLAVLGDQKQGTNIETPENLLRQIVREELAGSGNNRGPVEIALRVTGGKGFLREIRFELDDESKRNGISLVHT